MGIAARLLIDKGISLARQVPVKMDETLLVVGFGLKWMQIEKGTAFLENMRRKALHGPRQAVVFQKRLEAKRLSRWARNRTELTGCYFWSPRCDCGCKLERPARLEPNPQVQAPDYCTDTTNSSCLVTRDGHEELDFTSENQQHIEVEGNT